jgi:hypothetical protein
VSRPSMCHHRAVHRDGFEQTHAVASIAAIPRQRPGRTARGSLVKMTRTSTARIELRAQELL